MLNDRLISHSCIQPLLAEKMLACSARYEPYVSLICSMAEAAFEEIEIVDPAGSAKPGWRQGFFTWIDALSLCAVLRHRNPATYLEIGSGNSTRFARWCIRKYGLRTKIVSIDPQPRIEVDDLADRIVRMPVEQAPRDEFDNLAGDDICFYDGSHFLNMGGDMAYVCYQVFPSLPSSIMLGLHDTYLPVLGWNAEDYYAGALLLGGDRYVPDLPTHYLACVDKHYRDRLLGLLATPAGQKIRGNHEEMHAASRGHMGSDMQGATFFFSKA